MAKWILKRTEYIEVEANCEDEANELINQGKGEHVHETEELYQD